MLDLLAISRGLEFQCLGLAECAAESEQARCPCARRLISQPRVTTRQATCATRNPPTPKLGDLLVAAIRKAGRNDEA